MIPLKVADKLSVFYKAKLSFILGINDDTTFYKKVTSMNYEKLLKNINVLKEKNNQSYAKIAKYLSCSRGTCNKYFNGNVVIPIDRLISLSKLYNIDIDKLCGKSFKN